MKKLLFFIIVSLLSFSCLEVWDCRVTNKKFNKSLEYTNQTPLTVLGLKDLIFADTTRYKVIFYFSPCCSFVHSAMKTTFIPFYQECDTSKIRIYFVSSSYGDVKYNERYFNERMKFTVDKIYYMRDPLLEYIFYKNGQNYEDEKYYNMLNFIFPDTNNLITSLGTPATFIVSKDNKLKRAVYTYKDKKGEKKISTEPLYLGDMEDRDFDKIDFSVVDELTVVFDN